MSPWQQESPTDTVSYASAVTRWHCYGLLGWARFSTSLKQHCAAAETNNLNVCMCLLTSGVCRCHGFNPPFDVHVSVVRNCGVNDLTDSCWFVQVSAFATSHLTPRDALRMLSSWSGVRGELGLLAEELPHVHVSTSSCMSAYAPDKPLNVCM